MFILIIFLWLSPASVEQGGGKACQCVETEGGTQTTYSWTVRVGEGCCTGEFQNNIGYETTSIQNEGVWQETGYSVITASEARNGGDCCK